MQSVINNRFCFYDNRFFFIHGEVKVITLQRRLFSRFILLDYMNAMNLLCSDNESYFLDNEE